MQDAPTGAAPRLAPHAPALITVPAESRIELAPMGSFHLPASGDVVRTGITLVAGEYVRIELSGLVTIKATEQCYESRLFCPTALDGRVVGPAGVLEIKMLTPDWIRDWSYFNAAPYIHPSAFPRDTFVDESYNLALIELGGEGRTGVDTVHAIGRTYYLPRTASLSAVASARVTGEVVLRRPTFEGTDWMFATGPSQSVGVFRFVPLRMMTGTAVEGGATRFVAQTSGSPVRVRWTYLENDTTARWGSHIQFVSVPECANQMSCEYAPRKVGRMELSVRLAELAETRYAKSEVVPAAGAAPKLALTCTGDLGENRVTRGREIVCTARKEPADAHIADLKWVFAESAASYSRGPTGDDSLMWGGVMVRGGRITLMGVTTDDSVSASVDVVVVPRRWRSLRPRVHDDGHGDLPEPALVDSLHKLAHTHFHSPARYDTARVASGPNEGWLYLKSYPDTVSVVVHINAAFRAGSAWHQSQTGGYKRDAATNRVLGRYCRGDDIPAIERATREHEGLTESASVTSHVDVLRDWFRTHSPVDAFESVVMYGGASTGEVFDDLLQSTFYRHIIRAALDEDPNQRHTNAPSTPGRVDPAIFNCYLRPWD